MRSESVLVCNARAVLGGDGDADSVLVRDGVIAAIGRDLVAPDVPRLDVAGGVVIPGLVNTHHHLFQSLTRARAHGQELFGWLGEHWGPWGAHDVHWQTAAARVAGAELLLSGCTTTVDHHYLPSDAETLAAEVAAVTGLGLRLVAALGSMDLDDAAGGLAPAALCETPADYLARVDQAIAAVHEVGAGARVQIAVAPCHPLAVSEGAAREAVVLARDRGVRIHTHVAEAWGEEAATVAATGHRPVDLLDAWGLLGPDVWLAHGVHLRAEDRRLLADRGTALAVCPASNLRLGSGIAAVRELLDAGVTVGLGVDGSASNDAGHLLQEARLLLLVSRASGLANGISALEALDIATAGGAAALGRPDLGRLEVGRRGDLAVFDVSGLSSVGTQDDPLAGLLLAPPAVADHVLVDGAAVVTNGRLVHAEVAELVADAEQVLARHR